MSKRNDRKHHHINTQKEAVKLDKERRRIWQAQQDLGWIELEKPIFIGYIKDFVLREDIARRKDAEVFESILESINDSIMCNRKDFMTKDWKTKKMIPIGHHTKKLTQKQFDKLSEGQKKYFSKGYFDKLRPKWRYTFVHEYYFTERVRKNYATKVREHDSKLDKREQEIDAYFQKNNMWPKLSKAKSGWGHCRHSGDIADRERMLNEERKGVLRDVISSVDRRIYRIKI